MHRKHYENNLIALEAKQNVREHVSICISRAELKMSTTDTGFRGPNIHASMSLKRIL